MNRRNFFKLIAGACALPVVVLLPKLTKPSKRIGFDNGATITGWYYDWSDSSVKVAYTKPNDVKEVAIIDNMSFMKATRIFTDWN